MNSFISAYFLLCTIVSFRPSLADASFRTDSNNFVNANCPNRSLVNLPQILIPGKRVALLQIPYDKMQRSKFERDSLRILNNQKYAKQHGYGYVNCDFTLFVSFLSDMQAFRGHLMKPFCVYSAMLAFPEFEWFLLMDSDATVNPTHFNDPLDNFLNLKTPETKIMVPGNVELDGCSGVALFHASSLHSVCQWCEEVQGNRYGLWDQTALWSVFMGLMGDTSGSMRNAADQHLDKRYPPTVADSIWKKYWATHRSDFHMNSPVVPLEQFANLYNSHNLGSCGDKAGFIIHPAGGGNLCKSDAQLLKSSVAKFTDNTTNYTKPHGPYMLGCDSNQRDIDGLSCIPGSVLDGEGRPTDSIVILTSYGGNRKVPIEVLYANLRSYRFETKFRSVPNCFDCAGNHLTPDYLLMLPRVVNVCALYDRRIFIDLGSGSWQATSQGGLRGLGGWIEAYPGTQGRLGSSVGKIDWSWTKLGFFHEYHEFDYMQNLTDDQAQARVQRPPWVNVSTLYEYHNRVVTVGDDVDPPEIDLSSFLLRFKKSDFIHVKVDIENCEWKVLEKLIESNVIDYIDELTLEVHFMTDDPAWRTFLKAASMLKLLTNGPCPGSHTREEAHDLIQRLRKKGVYTHTYP